MRNVLFSTGSRGALLPNVGGKACAQAVRTMWAGSGTKMSDFYTNVRTQRSLRITTPTKPSLYTKCMQICTATQRLLNGVNFEFYTVSTGPTNITTTYINTIKGTSR